MQLAELANKSVCILGFGKEGQSVLGALRTLSLQELVVADQNTELQVDGCTTQLGSDYLKGLERFDVIIKSPGIPPYSEIVTARERGQVTGSLQIFIDTVRAQGALVIGVTGSKGKSTTSSLIHAGLVAGGKQAFLVGNIGTPAFDAIGEVKSDAIFVIEMSSYQLMDITAGPDLAVVTSFFPEHLDYHGSLDDYLAAKMRIATTQPPTGTIFYNANSPECSQIGVHSLGTKVPVSRSDSPLPITETHLLGDHNLMNLGLAWKVVESLGVTKETVQAAFRDFKSLPHRLEVVGTYHDIVWVDDAISTTPESTIAALNALGANVETLVVGGLDRGYDFSVLGKRIAASSVKNLIMLPGTGEAIRDAVGGEVASFPAQNMQEVVQIAREHTTPGKTCLLSTASPSYNSFKNFEEKGRLFQEAIRA